MSGERGWWGPRIWRIVHCLAEISDRTDCGPGWRVVLQETVQMLPCDMCREHFGVAVRGLHLPLPMPGSTRTPREAVRRMLWQTHSATGGVLPEEELAAVYGYGGDRGAVVAEVRRLLNEVAGAFRAENVLDRFRVGHLEAWVRAVTRLADLLLHPQLVGGSLTGRTRKRM
jgi:hypothetical protein